jgi:hypothetical protein
VAQRANRPVLAACFGVLTALKPHLFLFFAIGLVIDALRTPFGRRVAFGGLLVIACAAVPPTLANPQIWSQYLDVANGAGGGLAPKLSDWLSPTIQAWVRHFVPGRPFWVQWVPAAVGGVAFGIYWWRRGKPERWPTAILRVLPACLLVAPHGCWPSDLTILLIPIVALAIRLDDRGWAMPGRRLLTGIYAATNLAVFFMFVAVAEIQYYAWAAPVLTGCMLWVHRWLERSAPPQRGTSPRSAERSNPFPSSDAELQREPLGSAN